MKTKEEIARYGGLVLLANLLGQVVTQQTLYAILLSLGL